MTWVIQAIRMQQLKARVNELQSKQLAISQEIMDLQRYASNIEDGIVTVNEAGNTPSKYFGEQMGFLEASSQLAFESAQIKTDAYIQQLQLTGQNTNNQYQLAMGDTVQPAVLFNAIYKKELEEYAEQVKKQINEEEKELEQEKLTIETQLKAAESEYQSLEQSLDKSIQSSAIKLV